MALIPTQTTLTIGGRVFTDLANLIVLYAGPGINSKSTFRTAGGSSGYTPSGSKTFVCAAWRANIAAGTSIQIGYTDNDVGLQSAGSFTNFVQPGHGIPSFYAAGALENVEQILTDFTVPNGKYLSLDGGGANLIIQVFGYEV